MSTYPNGHIPDPEPPDEEVQPVGAPFTKIFFSIPAGYWEMNNEQKDAWASEVATKIEQENRPKEETGN
jgi:hypothetical protein